jgi:hypothetical protein
MSRIKIMLTGSICFLAATSFATKSDYSLNYPIGDEAGLASVFGPRALTGNSDENSWFHPGVDCARVGANGTGSNPTTGSNAYMVTSGYFVYSGTESIEFWNNTSNGPEFWRYIHVTPDPDFVVDDNTSYDDGSICGTVAYNSSGNHIHFETWEWNVFSIGDFRSLCQGSQTNFNLTRAFTTNPMKWTRYDYYSTDVNAYNSVGPNSNCRMSVLYSPTLTQTWPTESIDGQTLRYIKLDVTSKNYDYTLNKIVVSLRDDNGHSTQSFLYNIAGALDAGAGILFADPTYVYAPYLTDNGKNIKRDCSGVSSIEQTLNGWKVNPASMNTGGTKKITFKLFINATYTPTSMDVSGVDCRDQLCFRLDNVPLATCVSGTCPSNIQGPVISSVVNTNDGITINWNKVTGATGYVIYRRKDSTPSIKSAVPIGIVRSSTSSFNDSYSFTGLFPYGTYFYSVASLDNYWLEGPNGPEYHGYAGTPPVFMTFPSYRGYKGSDPLVWGFSSSTNMTVPYAALPDIYTFYGSTYIQILDPSLGAGNARIPVSANRSSSRIVVSCTMDWSDDPIVGAIRMSNSFALQTFDNKGNQAYAIRYQPIGPSDNGPDIFYDKGGVSQFGGYNSNTKVVSKRWMDFCLILNKLTSAGGEGTVEGWADYHDGKGKRKCFSFSDATYSQIGYVGVAVVKDGAQALVKADNIIVRTSD